MGLAQFIIPDRGIQPGIASKILRQMEVEYSLSRRSNDLNVLHCKQDKGTSDAFLEVAVEDQQFYIHRSGEAYGIYGRIIDLICQECGTVKIEDA
jgi:hypothetical protein